MATTTTTGAALPDCMSSKSEKTCLGIEGCRWTLELGCILECEAVSDEATCLELTGCIWSPRAECQPNTEPILDV